LNQAVSLASKSDSIILVLLVVVAIVMIPVAKTWAGILKDKRKQDSEREDKFIQVIERNTEVNAALKALIEGDQKHCDTCKAEQMSLFRKLFDNQEIANMKLTAISTKIGVSPEGKDDVQ
jgi:hypothetical protein